MYRVRRRGTWRNRWPYRKWIKPKVDERFCRECELPYQNGPLPEEKAQFVSGNVAAILLPKAGWKERYTLRIGRWKPAAGRFFLSEYIPSDELEDLELVVAQVRDYLDAESGHRSSRSAVRHDSARPHSGRAEPRKLRTSSRN